MRAHLQRGALAAPSPPALPVLAAASLCWARELSKAQGNGDLGEKGSFLLQLLGPGQVQAGVSGQTDAAGCVQGAPLPAAPQRSHFRPVKGNFTLHPDFFRDKNK